MAGELRAEEVGRGLLAGHRGKEPDETVELGGRHVRGKQNGAESVSPELGVEGTDRGLSQIEPVAVEEKSIRGCEECMAFATDAGDQVGERSLELRSLLRTVAKQEDEPGQRSSTGGWRGHGIELWAIRPLAQDTPHHEAQQQVTKGGCLSSPRGRS